jgi:hypothetical protein
MFPPYSTLSTAGYFRDISANVAKGQSTSI